MSTVRRTSWKSCDISHTRQEFDCISHLCLSERKKSRSSGVCVRAWTMQFMKHVLPRFISPRKPAEQKGNKRRGRRSGLWRLNTAVTPIRTGDDEEIFKSYLSLDYSELPCSKSNSVHKLFTSLFLFFQCSLILKSKLSLNLARQLSQTQFSNVLAISFGLSSC